MPPRLITPAQRALRAQGKEWRTPAPEAHPVMLAAFRVKGGCKTCKPIPAPSRPVNSLETATDNQ